MPRPTSRDTPKFDSDEPENLRRFLGQMEDLFSDYSVTDDNEKKKKLVRYTDACTEEELQALEEYDGGTFAEFKDAILKKLSRGGRCRDRHLGEAHAYFT